jgi:hypothetical protein
MRHWDDQGLGCEMYLVMTKLWLDLSGNLMEI